MTNCGGESVIQFALSVIRVRKLWRFRNDTFAGTREYGIVAPEAETIELFVLRKGAYALVGKYGAGGTVRTEELFGLKIKTKAAFVF